jgi:ATP-binding protein involved in chromosome partitioning
MPDVLTPSAWTTGGARRLTNAARCRCGRMMQAQMRRNDVLSTVRIPGVSHVLAVVSGKGSIGKTTVAVNLALALHLDGLRVGLFDADLHGPNIPLMLGIRPKPAAGKSLNIPVVRTERQPYSPPLERFGLKAMSLGLLVGDSDTIRADGPLAARMICRTLQDVLWGELDVLLLDFPPGTGEPQQTLLNTVHLDGVVLVTTPQDLSLMDTGRSLSLFRRTGVPILGVVEKMWPRAQFILLKFFPPPMHGAYNSSTFP